MPQKNVVMQVSASTIQVLPNVDGVYDADPRQDANATKFDNLSHLDVIAKGLKVMDSTASSLSMDNDIPLAQ